MKNLIPYFFLLTIGNVFSQDLYLNYSKQPINEILIDLSAKYNVQVVDSNGGNFEIFEANVVHDGTTAYVSTFGGTGTSTGLISVSADIDSGNLRLLGTINNTNDHVVKVVRRVIEV